MATRKKETPTTEETQVVVPNGTAVTNWEDEMAREAAVAAKMEQNSGGGQFFSVKAGQLAFADAPIPNNQMAVVILDSIMENVYYTGDYDPDNPQGPACFAFGRDEAEMVPHEVVFTNGTQQSEKCQTCQWNQWGTADKGKGKACKNARRLALIGAGSLDVTGKFTLDESPDSYLHGPVGFLRVPVTSVKGYALYVKQLASVMKRPPYGVITKVRVMPDPKTQLRVVFEMLDKVPNELMGIIKQRHEEVKGMIDFPYQVNAEEEDAPSPKKAVKGKVPPVVAAKGKAKAPARAAKY